MDSTIRVPEGLEGVVVAETGISEIDAGMGRLSYRGIPIEEVAERFRRWEDLVPWLVHGVDLDAEISNPTSSTSAVSAGLPIVQVIQCVLSGNAVWPFPDRETEIAWLTGIPAVVVGELPQRHTSAAAAYLTGLRHGRPPSLIEEKTLNAYWIIAAEHSLNASTYAVRVAASTGTSLPLALTAGLATLAGPLHGGAPEGVLALLQEAGGVEDLDAWLTEKVERGERLMGFGHRVYRTGDPRAAALRDMFRHLADESDAVRHAAAVEEACLQVLKRLKPQRPLATNVEFYAAAVLQGLKIPPEWCPATFALARLAGYTAHYYEQRARGRLIRPLALYRPQ